MAPLKVSRLSLGPFRPTVRVAPLVKCVSSQPSLTTYPLCMSLVITVGSLTHSQYEPSAALSDRGRSLATYR